MRYLLKCASVDGCIEELNNERGFCYSYAMETNTVEGIQHFHEACFLRKANEFRAEEVDLKAINIYTILGTEDECETICDLCGKPIAS